MKKLFLLFLFLVMFAFVSNAAQTITVDNNGNVISPIGPITFYQNVNISGGYLTISNSSPTIVSNVVFSGYIVSQTNATPNGSTIDFGIQYSTTNAANNVSFTSFLNVNPTNYNSAYIFVIPSGGNRMVTIPSSNWKSTDGNRMWTVTNNTIMKLTIELQLNVFTNVEAKFYN